LPRLGSRVRIPSPAPEISAAHQDDRQHRGAHASAAGLAGKVSHCALAARAHIPPDRDHEARRYVDDAELLERAALYRAMAKQALRAKLSSEFTARAERYEIAAQALRREAAKPPRP
jgi:hypothetical protein